MDNIADSFDYKNKYAIIEYLKEISEHKNFQSIILTHNFDFYRTVQERVILHNKYTNSYIAHKDKDQIYLEQRYISNPFKAWKKDLGDDAKLIALIAFARNIAEYVGDKDSEKKLTSILHIKRHTSPQTVQDLLQLFAILFKDINDTVVFTNRHKYVNDLIFVVANILCKSEIDMALNLENKIVLSIAIRLTAEGFMIDKINDNNFVTNIKRNQTGMLFREFKNKFPYEYNSIEILERVNLMTPENIHLNSFMYEPILDISDHHLKRLYLDLMTLIYSEETSLIRIAVAKENHIDPL